MKRLCIQFICLMSVVALLCPLAGSMLPAAAADVRVPYTYSIDNVCGQHVSGTMIGILRDLTLPYGEEITAAGWVATPEGISGYEYAWVPVGGGAALWQTVKDPSILPRGDLKAADVPHESGHSTAGFTLKILPPEGTPEGYYDVYIRAIDGGGVPCDLVALLSLRYGDVDYDDRRVSRINLSRLVREGADAIVGDATVTDSALTLGDGDLIRLGNLNLVVYEKLRITYEISPDGLSVGDGRRAVLGLKSSGKHSYGRAGEPYNLTDDLGYAALPNGATGEGVLEMDLSECVYDGEVWLSGYLGGRVTVKEIELTYNGRSTDRVSAKIYLNEHMTAGHFNMINRTDLTGVTDPVLGEVLRMEVNEATNDPYAFFHAGVLLEEYGLALDARDYKYMVLLYRAQPTNAQNLATLYLCAGAIGGPTEACTKGLQWQADGEWHYLLVDLSATANWTGVITGWRFDYLSGDSRPGDAVEFASIQLFRTEEKAREYAARDPLAADPYRSGQPAVVKDLCENSAMEHFVIDPADSFVVTEPAEEPTTPADPDPDTPDTPNTPTTPDAATDLGNDTPPTEKKKGCASSLSVPSALLLPVAAIMFVRKCKKETA